ncbi:leucine-rich repeat domain-containing protein, partial [Methanomethylophilus alvi]|uniref:leucine-rich repeat domain-containing protein n=1 Tax=Methanomethylophilus alvi TaxID=1291540 RepID=UPI0037DDBC2C
MFAVLVMVSVSAYAVISECSDGSEAASDDSGSCGDKVTYMFDSSTGTLTIRGSGDIYSYSSDGNAPWYPWSPYRWDVKNVVIEDGVTSIGQSAFYGCTSLTSVTIPDSVTSIGQYAFEGCTGLKELTIPISVNAVGSNSYPAFYGCTNIEKVTFTPGTGKGYDYGYSSSSSYGNYYGYTPWHYSSVALEVVIEDGVTSIGSYAFSGCSSLASITIPDGVTSIGSYAFRGCSSLVSITIPDGVTSIGSYAFSGCSSLASVTIGGDTSIGDDAFSGCTGLEELVIGNSVTSLDRGAFYGCSSLTSIVVAEGNKEYCSVDGVLFSKDMKMLVQYPAGRPDDPYVIPDSVTSIGDDAFYRCSSLASITIPDSVTSIGQYAFGDCTGLKELTIPISVNAVGSNSYPAFYGCTNIEKVTFTPGTGKGYDYGDSSSSCYTPWYYSRAVLKEVVIEDGVTSIGDDAFYGCTSLASVVIGDGVTSIGSYAFCRCSSLVSVTIPDSVTFIGNEAFRGCSSLASITIPDGVTSIGHAAFFECFPLASVTIPDSVTSIGSSAFYRCTGLKEIVIGNGVTSIGDSAFEKCTSLVSVTIPDSVTSIGNEAFYGCSSLTSVTIPDSVTSICYWAFRECSSLTSVTIPDSVTYLGICAFYGCSSLTSIILPDSVTSIDYAAFDGCTAVSSIRIGPDVSSIGDRAFGDIVFYDRDAVSVLSSDADSLKGGCFVKTDDRMVKVDGHMMSFYVDGKVVYRGVFVEGDENTPIPDVPFRPGYLCSWEEFELGTEDVSVNAVYVLRELMVSFDPNGGSGSMDPVITDVEHPFLRPDNGFSAPDHMHFAGWAYSSDGEPIDFDGLHMADDAVLYALWAWDQYDVVYKVDGETVFTDTFDYGTEVTVRDMFQKTGYTVTDWSTDDAEVSDGKFVLGASDV